MHFDLILAINFACIMMYAKLQDNNIFSVL